MAQMMMDCILIGEVETKDIMTKSSLPVGGYSVNPYVGCTHALSPMATIPRRRSFRIPESFWNSFAAAVRIS